jgi:hypothetical protein
VSACGVASERTTTHGCIEIVCAVDERIITYGCIGIASAAAEGTTTDGGVKVAWDVIIERTFTHGRVVGAGPIGKESGRSVRSVAAGVVVKTWCSRSARNSESEVNSNRSVSLGRQGRLDYVNFGTYVSPHLSRCPKFFWSLSDTYPSPAQPIWITMCLGV